jgi:hypothetical protein
MFYGRHQHGSLRLYLSLTRLVRTPVMGRLVRWVANAYARLGHSGYYLTMSEAEKIVDIAGTVALGPCSCRAEYHHCDYPIMSEIVLGNGSNEVYGDKQKEFRQISKEEAKNILRQAHEHRLTQSIMRCGKHFYAICSCCSCCCVPTRLRRDYGIGMALVRKADVVGDFQRQQLE